MGKIKSENISVMYILAFLKDQVLEAEKLDFGQKTETYIHTHIRLHPPFAWVSTGTETRATAQTRESLLFLLYCPLYIFT